MSAGLIMVNKIFVLIIVGLILIAFYLISPYRYKAILNKQIETTKGYVFNTIILDTWTGESWLCLTETKPIRQFCFHKIGDGEGWLTKDGKNNIIKIPIIEGNKK